MLITCKYETRVFQRTEFSTINLASNRLYQPVADLHITSIPYLRITKYSIDAIV